MFNFGGKKKQKRVEETEARMFYVFSWTCVRLVFGDLQKTVYICTTEHTCFDVLAYAFDSLYILVYNKVTSATHIELIVADSANIKATVVPYCRLTSRRLV